MKKVDLKVLKFLAAIGAAEDITNLNGGKKNLGEYCVKLAYSQGTNGINGLLLKGESGKLYAITCRCDLVLEF